MQHASRYDVIVVGAGPAGSTAASMVARQGFRVALLDKRIFPRPKLCAGLLTEKTTRLLEFLWPNALPDLLSSGIVHTVADQYAIHSRTSELYAGRLEKPFHLVERKAYDKHWVDMARHAGCHVLLGTAVQDVEPNEGSVTLTSGQRLSASYIIGADGANSRIRRVLLRHGLLPGAPSRLEKGTACALEVFLPGGTTRPLPPSIHFGFVRKGYAWDFPAASGRVLGICSLPGNIPDVCARVFPEFLSHRGYKKTDISNALKRVKGHFLPYGGYLLQPGHGHILLCGDACGFADPLLGEGIYYAHQSGRLAGLAVTRSLELNSSALALYRDMLKKVVIKELRWARWWRDFVFTMLSPWDYRLLGLMVRAMPKHLEETIHGRRSFRFLRSLSTSDIFAP